MLCFLFHGPQSAGGHNPFMIPKVIQLAEKVVQYLDQASIFTVVKSRNRALYCFIILEVYTISCVAYVVFRLLSFIAYVAFDAICWLLTNQEGDCMSSA